jgi:hypothetical protein
MQIQSLYKNLHMLYIWVFIPLPLQKNKENMHILEHRILMHPAINYLELGIQKNGVAFHTGIRRKVLDIIFIYVINILILKHECIFIVLTLPLLSINERRVIINK